MRIHGIQLAYGDDETLGQRRDRVVGLLREQSGADLVVLPELWAHTGFGWRGWEANAEPLDGPTVTAVAEAAAELRTTVHAGSIIERAADGRLYNTAVLIGPDGGRLASYRKIHRFGFSAGEPTLLQAGEDLVVTDLPAGTPGGTGATGRTVRTALATCYDLRFPELFRALLRSEPAPELFVVPAAWPKPRLSAWTVLGQARALENQAIVIQVNTAGTHNRTQMGGCSQVVGPMGEVLATAGTGQEVMVVDVDVEQVAAAREAFPVLADRRLP